MVHCFQKKSCQIRYIGIVVKAEKLRLCEINNENFKVIFQGKTCKFIVTSQEIYREMNHIRIAVCSIVLLILAGCKGGKELISERPVSQEVRNNFESLMASYPDWNTFSAKGSADLSFGASGSLSASTQLRMVRGEVLQISVRIILGIEVARLYMTPDSLFLVNKMQKQYVAASLQEIGERLSSPVSLQTVQDALLGRIFLLNLSLIHI